MITGTGAEMKISTDEHADLLPAVQVALGTLGVLTGIKMQLIDRHKLHRRVWFAPYDEVLANAKRLWADNRNYEFFYLPFSNTAMCITHNLTEAACTPAWRASALG